MKHRASSMWERLVCRLDQWAIQLACGTVPPPKGRCTDVAEAARLLDLADLPPPKAPLEVRFSTETHFMFNSPVVTPWAENNVVHGRLFRAGSDWRTKPAVILVHGWNAENCYNHLFPYMARRFRAQGVNTVAIQLPLHAQRKPRRPGCPRNFISNDLIETVLLSRQAIADTQATIAWLRGEGVPRAGVYGFSLGAWLAGLVAAREPAPDFAVLATPIVRMEQAVRDLAFCGPLKASIAGTNLSFAHMNLDALTPRCPTGSVLIVASKHDTFAPLETAETLCRAWPGAELWRVPHGHISVLGALPTLERTVKWIARTASRKS